ncbi:MAG: hypothetical protein H6517_06630 [Microthrixaceae bacterium]|nr:hypothetical protein [Microthrixaceae bacterium]MCO5322020.1 hypothetical protein [Microthrixaceae bacterium]
MVAGAEALAVGTLIVLAGLILVVNAWAVVDTRTALESAAREYLRVYTESEDPASAATAGRRAVDDVLEDRPAMLERLLLEAPQPERFGPCEAAAVRLTSRVPAIHVPLTGARWGEHTVTVSAVELIDAHREMEPGVDHDPRRTACHE